MHLSLDLGTSKIGSCLFFPPADLEGPPPLPLRLAADPVSLEVAQPPNPRTIAAQLLEAVTTSRPTSIIVEHAPLYIPPKAPAQQARSIAANHELCSLALLLLEDGCAALEPPIPVHVIARSTWAGRIAKGQTIGGNRLTTADARAKVPTYLDPSGPQPTDQHQIDAVGALLGHLYPAGVGIAPRPPRPPRVKRKPGEPKPPRVRDRRPEIERRREAIREIGRAHV